VAARFQRAEHGTSRGIPHETHTLKNVCHIRSKKPADHHRWASRFDDSSWYTRIEAFRLCDSVYRLACDRSHNFCGGLPPKLDAGLTVAMCREQCRDTPCDGSGIASLALPDDENSPSLAAKCGDVMLVPGSITGPLGLPEFDIRRRRTPATFAGMHVPITSVNEYNSTTRTEYQVRLSGQIRSMQAESKAEPMCDAPHERLQT